MPDSEPVAAPKSPNHELVKGIIEDVVRDFHATITTFVAERVVPAGEAIVALDGSGRELWRGVWVFLPSALREQADTIEAQLNGGSAPGG